MTNGHNITFIPCAWNTDMPIEVSCSCGEVIQAHNGTDALEKARTHVRVARNADLANEVA